MDAVFPECCSSILEGRRGQRRRERREAAGDGVQILLDESLDLMVICTALYRQFAALVVLGHFVSNAHSSHFYSLKNKADLRQSVSAESYGARR